MKHYGDITKIKGYAVPPVDVITGGSPCQDLSVAGKRAGLDGERSGLFMEQIRIIKEMRDSDRRNGRSAQLVRPRYMAWENVYGAFSSNKGEDFRVVLEETAKIADKDAIIPRLEEKQKWTPSGCILGEGWSIAWRVHDAQFWGVPQRRRRIALVADFNGQSAPEILFERKSVSGNTEPSEETRQGTADDIKRNIGDASSTIIFIDYVPMITQSIYDARDNGDGNNSYTLTGDHQNRVTDYTALVLDNQPKIFDMGNERRRGIKKAESVCPTITSHGGTGGNNIPCVAYGFDPSEDREVGEFSENDKSASLKAQGGTYGGGSESIVKHNAIVRRLTPLECERLQGFPDGWTDIGDWVDSKGKKHKGEADSPRYKALGNSIALPFWHWMAQRMAAHLPESSTMASLFDGIGGFPLVYSRVGITPLWASEIEEFPIAVTKVRFGDE